MPLKMKLVPTEAAPTKPVAGSTLSPLAQPYQFQGAIGTRPQAALSPLAKPFYPSTLTNPTNGNDMCVNVHYNGVQGGEVARDSSALSLSSRRLSPYAPPYQCPASLLPIHLLSPWAPPFYWRPRATADSGSKSLFSQPTAKDSAIASSESKLPPSPDQVVSCDNSTANNEHVTSEPAAAMVAQDSKAPDSATTRVDTPLTGNDPPLLRQRRSQTSALRTLWSAMT